MSVTSGSARPRLATLAVLAAGMLGAVYAPASAAAAEAKTLKVKRFTLETTRTEELPGTEDKLRAVRRGETGTAPFSNESWGFANVPAAFTQAGGHPNGQDGGPDALTATVEFETELVKTTVGSSITPTRDPKDVDVSLPPGLLGDPMAVPRCPLKEALSSENSCSASTQVGVAVVYWGVAEGLVMPIVNATPEAGQSAEFVLESSGKINFRLTAHLVRSPDGYTLTVNSEGIPSISIPKVETTFWGVPADPIHDPQRGLFCQRLGQGGGIWGCGGEGRIGNTAGGEASGVAPVAFLTMPADCTSGAEYGVVRADSWEEPGRYVEKPSETPLSATLGGVTGCNLLQFQPGIETRPETTLADAPTGLGVHLSVPQEGLLEPGQLATPQLRSAAITLPLGISVSPGIVDGIQACEETGPHGIDMPTGLNANGQPLQPGELGEGEQYGLNGQPQLAPGHCPNESLVGTAETVTPLLSEPIRGHVYLAKPGCGGAGQRPCTEADALDGNLYKLYLELGGEGPLANTGVNIKVRLATEADPATGQLTTVALENPQLPFSELKIHLNGGPRAPLDTPPACGPARTTADLGTWAAPGSTPSGVSEEGVSDATPSSFFAVTGCLPGPPLAPEMLAQMEDPQAGQFSYFTFVLTRPDREQYVSGIQLHTPPGLLGMLASVPLCEEPAAQEGTCGAGSKIGTTAVASGAGSHPFEIGGSVYLTKGYKGAPFGLSIVTPAVAGPFNLGLVVVRAQIDVDPSTSTLTITTDPLPQILDGVPLRLKRITVHIGRPHFMFNPTNCSAQQIRATVYGAAGAQANVSAPFAVGGCRLLAFKPSFKVSTNGRTSRHAGASLDVKLAYPKGAMGKEANIARVKVDLPKQLPSYLPTLQKACPAATFDANPAACPQGSIVGIAKTKTPLLPVELSGPVYFVSHGGEEFPSLIIVLEGDGVRVDLVGSTFIKNGITSSTFKAVPDVPVDTFELFLPQGRNHALAASTNLCVAAQGGTRLLRRNVRQRIGGRTVIRTVTRRVKSKGLAMPTEFVAQNGAVIRRDTSIAVTGCANARTATRHIGLAARRRRSTGRGSR